MLSREKSSFHAFWFMRYFSTSRAAIHPNPAAACRATSTSRREDVDLGSDEIVAAGQLTIIDSSAISQPPKRPYTRTRRRSRPVCSERRERLLRHKRLLYLFLCDHKP